MGSWEGCEGGMDGGEWGRNPNHGGEVMVRVTSALMLRLAVSRQMESILVF